MKPKKTEQLNIRIDDDLRKILEAIEEENGLNPSVIIRSLLKEAAVFFQENGYFAPPVRIVPKNALGRGESPIATSPKTTASKSKATAGK